MSADLLLNIRNLNTKEWTDEIYAFDESMRDQLRDVYGTENVRTISQEEYERHLVRREQDAEFNATVAEEATQRKPVVVEDPAPPTLEELRALRVQYFEPKRHPTNLWQHRLRPRPPR